MTKCFLVQVVQDDNNGNRKIKCCCGNFVAYKIKRKLYIFFNNCIDYKDIYIYIMMHSFYYAPTERYVQKLWFDYVQPAYRFCASAVSYPFVWSGLMHGENDSRKVQTQCAHCGAEIDVYMTPTQYQEYVSSQKTTTTPIVQSIENSLSFWIYRSDDHANASSDDNDQQRSLPFAVCDHHCLQNWMATHKSS